MTFPSPSEERSSPYHHTAIYPKDSNHSTKRKQENDSSFLRMMHNGDLEQPQQQQQPNTSAVIVTTTEEKEDDDDDEDEEDDDGVATSGESATPTTSSPLMTTMVRPTVSDDSPGANRRELTSPATTVGDMEAPSRGSGTINRNEQRLSSSLLQHCTSTYVSKSRGEQAPSLVVSTNDVSHYNHSREPPDSPAFSIVTHTGADNALDDTLKNGENSNHNSTLVQPPLECDGITHTVSSSSEPSIPPEPVPTTSEEEEDNKDDDDSIVREKVEIQWTAAAAMASASERLVEVEHSFRIPQKRAWASMAVTPVDRIPYVHGSFASAAPLFMYNHKWMNILKKLMPANHADAMEILREAEEARSRKSNNDHQMARLMKWAENNPVVAAYGVLHSNCGADHCSSSDEQPASVVDASASASVCTPSSQGTCTRSTTSLRFGRKRRNKESTKRNKNVLPVLEWDVFLDPTLVKKVDAAMDIAQQLRDDDCADDQDQIAADIEVDRQVGRLINRMMLAHGSASHLVSEALGVASQYNFTKLVEQGESQRMYRRKEAEKKWKRSGLHFSRNGLDVGGKTWLIREQAHGSLMSFDNSHRRSVIAGKASAKPAGIFVDRWLALFLRALHIAKATAGALPSGHFYMEDDESTPQVEAEALQTGKPPMCGVFLCLGIEDPNAGKVDHAKTTMATTASKIEEALGSPLRVILDLKSRRVPARVWARVIDNMRSRGLLIEGLGSFDIDELRSVKALCASNVTEVRFFHSAGDLQKACHAKEVNVGDTVFFNAGSLLWEKPNKISNVVCGNPDVSQVVADGDDDDDEDGVRLQPFAFPRDYDSSILQGRSTLQQYKDKFSLNIGCYVQEFSISGKNLDALTRFLNKFKSVYNLGLAWGGLNGKCHEGLSGDGYWNQRYIGRSWDYLATPEDMRLLQPEDHPFVQKAMRAGAWGSIATVNYIGEEDLPETQAMQLGARAMENRPTCG